MTRILFLFMDGVGLGPPDPSLNPFALANMPNLEGLLEGRRLIAGSAPLVGKRATLLEIDARMGVEGAPQSATGQAALLTGRNVSAEIGGHYGPKPNRAISAILAEYNLFKETIRRGGSAALVNAYPPGYFEAIQSGRRLFSAIPLAASAAGLPLMTAEDLQAGRALSADFTGQGWHSQPSFPPAPVYQPARAGQLLAKLSEACDLCWFDYWLSDYAGHKQDLEGGVGLLESLDAVLGGLIEAWEDREDLIVLSSDHGNFEDMNKRGHTLNPVPGLLIGPKEKRRTFAKRLSDLTDFAPSILKAIFDANRSS